MQIIHITAIIYLFSVVIPIKSGEIIYTYDYYNLGEIFPQGSGINDFHLYRYSYIDTIVHEKYNGSNIGGAFLMEGYYETNLSEVPVFPGYLVNITATFYCGSTRAEEGWRSLRIAVFYVGGGWGPDYHCDRTGWHYDHTWTPSTSLGNQGFQVYFTAHHAVTNRAYGIDELRITTSKTPPQLLQRDNSTASNDP